MAKQMLALVHARASNSSRIRRIPAPLCELIAKLFAGLTANKLDQKLPCTASSSTTRQLSGKSLSATRTLARRPSGVSAGIAHISFTGPHFHKVGHLQTAVPIMLFCLRGIKVTSAHLS